MSGRDRRLARGAAWPLTRPDVLEALGEEFRNVREVEFWGQVPQYFVMDVHWRPGRAGGIHPDVYGIAVTIYPVRSVDRALIRGELRQVALPGLREWVIHAQGASETWKSGHHRRAWRWTEHATVQAEDLSTGV